MKINRIFDNTIQTLQHSIDIRARKHEVILSNIANADTPNYKAFELIMDEELSNSISFDDTNKILKTHPMHLPAQSEDKYGLGTVKMEISKEVSLRGDGNTVNFEKEMAELSENILMYRASTDILSRKFKGLLKVIQGSRGQ